MLLFWANFENPTSEIQMLKFYFISHISFFLIMTSKESSTLWISCSAKKIWNKCWHFHISLMYNYVKWNDKCFHAKLHKGEAAYRYIQDRLLSYWTVSLLQGTDFLMIWFWFRNTKRLFFVQVFAERFFTVYELDAICLPKPSYEERQLLNKQHRTVRTYREVQICTRFVI